MHTPAGPGWVLEREWLVFEAAGSDAGGMMTSFLNQFQSKVLSMYRESAQTRYQHHCVQAWLYELKERRHVLKNDHILS